jgi:D-arabinose 1-dehydrogenase-like Zn-dependent alcohol dehydrogenase
MGFNVVALSSSDSKKDLAKELGAQHYVDGSKEDQAEALQKLGGAKIIVCTAPKSEIINKLVHGLAVGGQLLVLALTDEVSIPVVYVSSSFHPPSLLDTFFSKTDSGLPFLLFSPLIQKRLSVRGWPAGAPIDEEDTIKFAMQSGVKCRIEKCVSLPFTPSSLDDADQPFPSRYKLEDIQKAYDSMVEGKARFRSVITFQ